jgi:hypothetical protein
MWVESVTVSESPPLREHVEAARLHFHALEAAVEPRGERREIVVEVMADPLLVVGDRFDIDQRAREFENVHKPPAGGGERKRGKNAPNARGLHSR